MRASVLRPLALVWVTAIGAAPVGAQALTVRVVEEGTTTPLRGALVVVGDADDLFVASALTDARGMVRFGPLARGSYSVRAEMIGHETRTYSAAVSPTDGAEPLVVALPVRALALEGLEVEGAERCRIGERDGRQLGVIWDEIRKALEAARWSEERALFEYRLQRVVRDRELRSQRVLEESASRDRGYYRTPYESLPVERLLADGFVQRAEGGGYVYYAPDAEVLLSEAFLETHCLRPVLGEDAEDGWVGIAFRPVDNRSVPDIGGTLWLDPSSWELRRLDFHYDGLRRPTPIRDIGGTVRFERLPDGTWIVPEWTIRTPLMGRGADLQGRMRVYQVGVREETGSVLQVRRPGGEVVLAAGTGTLEGVVLDSLGFDFVPGAAIELLGVGLRARTDEAGVFTVTGLAPDTYAVRLGHALLESFGYEARPVSVEVAPGSVSSIRLRMPSTRELLAARCPADAPTIVGRVLEASTGLPLPGARVTVGETQAEAGAEGRFVVCSIPSGAVVVTARWGPFSTSDTTVVALRAVEAGGGGSPGSIVEMDVDLPVQGVGVVRGEVKEAAAGIPIEGASVTLTPTGREGREYTGQSDESGSFVVEEVPGGEYRIEVSHSAYGAGRGTLRVGAGEDVTISVGMPRIPAELDRLLPTFASRIDRATIEVVRRTRDSGGR